MLAALLDIYKTNMIKPTGICMIGLKSQIIMTAKIFQHINICYC